jgi:hypothetical protein
VVTILFAATALRAGDHPAFAFIWATSLVLLCRVGLLTACAFDSTQYTLYYFLLTLHPSAWYFSQSAVVLTFCAGLAAFGFCISLGGEPVFWPWARCSFIFGRIVQPASAKSAVGASGPTTGPSFSIG